MIWFLLHSCGRLSVFPCSANWPECVCFVNYPTVRLLRIRLLKKYITIDNAWYFSSEKRAHYYLIFVQLPCEKENLLCLHDSMFPRLDLFLNYFYLIQYNVKCYKKSDDASLFKPGDLSSQETWHHLSFILWGQLTILLALFTRNWDSIKDFSEFLSLQSLFLAFSNNTAKG